MKSRMTHNRILSFIKDDKRVEDFGRVIDHFLYHFQNIMGTNSQDTRIIDPYIIACGKVLYINQQIGLIKPF